MDALEGNNQPQINNSPTDQDYNLKSENENINNLSRIKPENLYFDIQNPLIKSLIEFGYEPRLSKRLVYILHPANINQALEFLSERNGTIQHYFFENSIEVDKCFICEKGREQHLIKRNLYNLNKSENSSITESYLSKSTKIKDYSINIEKIIENKICTICEEEYEQSNYTTLEKCKHSFCKSCWINYLIVNINEKKLIKIKCMESSCNEILSENFIYALINDNNELILQFNENKLRQEILENPRKKFCPFPDCNSYARRNNKKENTVKCGNGHSFCFYCLKESHEGKCGKELDEKMEEFAKKKFIKKCPKCNIWSEKISGCNHITCIECGYQWCWLCNEKYDEMHYEKGKCKGFQFFKPTNEKDIQLAFEGKIRIEDYMSDIGDDFDIDNNFPNQLNRNNRNIFNREIIIFGPIKKIAMILLFLWFGIIFTIICESGRFLRKIGNGMRKYYNFFYGMNFLIYIVLGFILFIFQIYINIIILIMIIINNYLIDFYNTFYRMLRKIKNLSVMEEYNDIIMANIYKFITFFLSLLFGCFFWVLKFYGYHDLFHFLEKRQKIIMQKIVIFSFMFILFLIIVFFYPYSIVLNIIGIVEEINRRDFSRLQDHIQELIRGIFHFSECWWLPYL